MKIIKFKTNINCGGCLATVTPFLNGVDFISNWQVDTSDPDKVLTVSGEGLEPQQVKKLIEKAGFKAEVMRIQGIGGGDL
ncbi:MAG: heavy-metal-associated domain-containing protein [Bacteroidetes bacterium]|nr:heavy-metal-associated domain-containing protein [Bacteroidota bacterium]